MHGLRTVSLKEEMPRSLKMNNATNSVTGGRNFAKIIEDEQRDRHIIDLQITKEIVEDENGVMAESFEL